MRDIPASLLAKIKQTYQTIHGNAEPRMDIFVGREGDYLSALEKFFVITIQDGQTLNRIDVATARPDPYYLPTELTIVYLVDDDAYVATTPMPVHPKSVWTVQGYLGKAIDVTLEFEGYWVRRERAKENFEDPRTSRFSIVTVGDPWLFVTRPDGSVEARQGFTGSWTTIVASGVTRIDALAGWKGLRVGHDDQGLVVAYLKSGAVWYRTRAEQEDGTIIWEVEREVTDLPSNCVNVSLFRTNDYRMGFIAETDDDPPEIFWVLTERCWSGMATEDHYISAHLVSIGYAVTPIEYLTFQEQESHSVEMNMERVASAVCPIGTPATTVAGIPVTVGDTEIVLEFNGDILGNGEGFETSFSLSGGWSVVSTVLGATSSQLVLNVDAPIALVTSVTVSYTHVEWIKIDRGGACKPVFPEFQISVEVKQPQGFTEHAVSASLQSIEYVATPISYISAHQGGDHSVMAGLHSISFVITKVGEVDP